jgi:hypothetical protein
MHKVPWPLSLWGKVNYGIDFVFNHTQLYAKELIYSLKLIHYDRSQVDEYVSRHLEYAGVDQQIFSDCALEEIHRFSGGTPRLINKTGTIVGI